MSTCGLSALPMPAPASCSAVSSRPSSPASAAHGWAENPRPGPASTATTNRSACRPSSTTWPSRPRRR